VVRRPGAADRARLTGVKHARPSCATLPAMASADRRGPLHEEDLMYKRIIVPTDGSEITAKAVRTAVDLARLCGAELLAIAVKEPFPYSAISEMQPVPPQEFYDAQERVAHGHAKAVAEAAKAVGVNCQAHTVEALHPWEAIVEHAKEKQADLIVMASHGRRGVSALLLGSETQKVLTHATLPVLVVR